MLDRTLNREKQDRKVMEDEMRQLNRETGNSENTHKDHKLKQDKDRAADDGATARHDQEVTLATTLKEKKSKEKADLKAAL